MWTPVVQSGQTWPSSRSKHAGCVHVATGHVYILAGRNGNVALRDFWRYVPDSNNWEKIISRGDGPGCLQGHSMVEHQDTLYVFGGELSFCNDQETPLWMYDIKENIWEKYRAPRGVVTPKGRRGHSAVVYQDCMYVYGGYQDLRGSTSELWAFHLPSQTWHLVSQGGPAADLSPTKHHHTAIVHNQAMWVFGGMSDLQERSDCWKFDFVTRCWHPVRSKPGPGCLHSHSAVKIHNVMIIFGGEREGQTVNEVWRFHFATETWDKILVNTLSPQPRSQLVSFVCPSSSPLSSSTENGIISPNLGAENVQATPSLTRHAKAMVQRLKGEAENILESRHGGTQRYSFLPPESCTEDSDSDEDNDDEKFRRYRELPREIYRDLTRPSQFQRLESNNKVNEGEGGGGRGGGTNKVVRDRPGSIVKDLARVNLSLLNSNQSNNYHMFYNQSSDSLDSVQPEVDPILSFDLQKTETVPGGTMTKSDSAFTWQSYSCSSRNSTLSSHFRDTTDPGLNTEDEESSGYDSFEGVGGCGSGGASTHLTLLNPCYSGPDVDTHNSYAAVLKCPTESDKMDGRRAFVGVEMREKTSSRPEKRRPRSEIITSSIAGVSRARPVSDSDLVPREMTRVKENLVMYVVGGREVGQINMFQRNISIWKLQL